MYKGSDRLIGSDTDWNRLEENQINLDPKFVKIVDENFWDLF